MGRGRPGAAGLDQMWGFLVLGSTIEIPTSKSLWNFLAPKRSKESFTCIAVGVLLSGTSIYVLLNWGIAHDKFGSRTKQGSSFWGCFLVSSCSCVAINRAKILDLKVGLLG